MIRAILGRVKAFPGRAVPSPPGPTGTSGGLTLRSLIRSKFGFSRIVKSGFNRIVKSGFNRIVKSESSPTWNLRNSAILYGFNTLGWHVCLDVSRAPNYRAMLCR
jgi:hypothetical protein